VRGCVGLGCRKPVLGGLAGRDVHSSPNRADNAAPSHRESLKSATQIVADTKAALSRASGFHLAGSNRLPGGQDMAFCRGGGWVNRFARPRWFGLAPPVTRRLSLVGVAAALCVALALPSAAGAAAMQRLPGCTANTLPANDDSSTAAAVPLGFTIKINQATYTSAWVNNNGNITFDGPLVQFTPTPIASTNHVIVAPFWADVDTRGAGSAVVTYGTTTYRGRSAFCVEWDGVGYYNSHTDKLNKFELLLVNRPDRASGDFDIIFNYDQVQWETGDASGGSGGLGGTPARVGWSFGPGGNVELPGSGTPGSFLDGGPDALAGNDRGSSTPGSYVFPVHGGQAQAARYVALGDSYSAGEGVPPFSSGADVNDVPSNPCHRSTSAYPQLLVRDHAGGPIPPTVEHWACSGAKIADFTPHQNGSREPAQLDHLAPGDATLVTLGIGGNDIGFAHIGETCIKADITVLDQNHGGKWRDHCQNGLDKATMSAISNLNVRDLYAKVRAQAPLADVYVMGYPKILPGVLFKDCQAQAYREDGRLATTTPFNNHMDVNGFLGIEARIGQDAVIWMNKVVDRLNGKIRAEAAYARFHFVDVTDAFAGHDVCSNNTDPSNRPWAHLVVLFSDKNGASPFSAHPTAEGQAAMAAALYSAITSGPRPTVEPAHTSTVPVIVAVGQALLNIITQWHGSDMDTTLVSPSGQVFNASSPRITHFKTGTTENYVIPNPQPGTWQVRVYGTQVDQGGEPARVTSSTTPAAALAPVAVLSVPRAVGVARFRTRFSATSSSGTFASVSSYRWNFGDGSTSKRAVVSHTYRRAGTYTTTLTVTDAAGRTDTATEKIKVYRTDQRPTAQLVVHQDRLHGARLYYDATGSADPDGARVRLSISFGDGTSTSHAAGIHRYRSNGVYRLKLMVSDPRRLRRTRQVRIVVRHKPKSSKPRQRRAITTVGFAGDSANPQVTITGRGFGHAPAPTTVAYPGSTGYDYGSALYFCNSSSNPRAFCAGESLPTGRDYIGLVVSGYSDARISYTLGSTYSNSYYPGNVYRVNQGDHFTVHVGGLSCAGTIVFNRMPTSCKP
jgi:PKD repeat protein/lysophospholipase L1-like esterase